MAVLDRPGVASSARVSARVRWIHPETAAAVITLVTSMAVALAVGHPLLPELEAEYLLNAQWLAGVGQVQQPSLPVYSLLLAPILAATDSLDTILRTAQVLNALLAAVSAALTVRLLRVVVPSVGPGALVGLAVLINLYPPHRVTGTAVVAENLLVPASIATALAFARAVRAPSTVPVIAVSALAGATAAIHPVGVALSAGTAIALAVRLRTDGRRAILAAAPLVAALAVLLTIAAVTDAAASRVTVGAAPYPSWIDLITDNLSLRAVVRLPLTLLGTAFYLSVGTWGLATLGAVGLVRQLRSPDDGARDLATWTAAVMLSTLGLSALRMNNGTGSGAIYGRIAEPVLVPLLAFGAGMLVAGTTVQIRRLVLVFPAAAGAFLLIARRPTAFEEPVSQHFAVVAVEPLTEAGHGFHVPTLALAGVVGAAGVLLSCRRWPAQTLAALGIVFWATAVSAAVSIERDVDDVDTDRSVVEAVRTHLLAAGPGRPCIALDGHEVDDSAFQRAYRVALLQARFEDWDSTGDEPPCSAAVISARADLSASWPGATVLEAEDGARQLLWVLPGELQESLPDDRRGLEQPAAPLPAGPIATIEILDVDPATASPDARIAVSVRLTNRSVHPFVPSAALSDWVGGVAVGIEWRGPDASERLGDPVRVHLPRIVWPGDSVELTSVIRPLLPGRPLDPGVWLLRAELVQEGIQWFGDDVADETAVEVTGQADVDVSVEP